MRTLYLIRHAKSSWDDPGLGDFDRPLAPRGRSDAPRMARYMAGEGLVPDRVLCSPARRAVQTWELLAPELGAGVAVEYERGLYAAPWSRILEFVRAQPRGVARVLVVAHNPGLADLAVALCGSGEEASVGLLERKYPTAALTVITFPADSWGEVGPGGGRLLRFIRPRDL